MLLQIIEQMLLIQKPDEKEDDQLEKYIDKNAEDYNYNK